MSTGPVSTLTPTRFARAAMGGFLMGLANLVPGISGGTMLLAAGIYTHFIEAIATVSRGQLRRQALWLLLAVVGAAAVAVGLLAGTVKDLVLNHRWVMYSLFVGLTLGGIPALWRLVRPPSRGTWIGTALGFVVMAGLAIAQQTGAGSAGFAGGGVGILFIAGLAGAASMILPGISGGYLLLVLGQYLPILSAIETAVDAVRSGDLAALGPPVLGVFVPVGLGVVIGVAAVSNLLRHLLAHHRAVTLGVLLGLLGGVVMGLWPFQSSVPPRPGDVIRGRVVSPESVATIDRQDWRLARFAPTPAQAFGSLGLILGGGAVTYAFSRLRRDDADHDSDVATPR